MRRTELEVAQLSVSARATAVSCWLNGYSSYDAPMLGGPTGPPTVEENLLYFVFKV